MHWVTLKRLAVYQTTGIRLVVWIVFNHFAAKHATKDLVERQTIRLCLFVGVVSNSDSVIDDCGSDLGDIHVRLPGIHDLSWQPVCVKRSLKSSIGGHALTMRSSSCVGVPECYSPTILTNTRFRRRPSDSRASHSAWPEKIRLLSSPNTLANPPERDDQYSPARTNLTSSLPDAIM